MHQDLVTHLNSGNKVFHFSNRIIFNAPASLQRFFVVAMVLSLSSKRQETSVTASGGSSLDYRLTHGFTMGYRNVTTSGGFRWKDVIVLEFQALRDKRYVLTFKQQLGNF